jgi:hypothetical protein
MFLPLPQRKLVETPIPLAVFATAVPMAANIPKHHE